MAAARNAGPRLSLRERDRRWQAARALMEEHDVDALLVFSDRDGVGTPSWVTDHWLTNNRLGAYVVFPRVGDPVVHYFGAPNAMVDHMEATRREPDLWLSAEQFRLGRSGASLLRTISDLRLEDARFGVVGTAGAGPFYPDGLVPFGTYRAILDGLPRASFLPLDAAYGELVIARSPEELHMLRKSAADGEKMCEAAIDATRVGATDGDVLAAASAAALREGSWVYWSYLVLGDEDLSWGAPAWLYRGGGPREIRSGQVLLLEVMPFYGGYETQQKLTIAVGDVHPDFERGAALAERSYQAGVQALRDGASTFGEVDDAMTSLIRDADAWNSTPNVHTLPHQGVGSMGPAEPEPWMEAYHELGTRPLRPTTGADVKVQPGMVFTMQPNCIYGRRRVNLGGTVITTTDGIEELNDVCNTLVRVDG